MPSLATKIYAHTDGMLSIREHTSPTNVLYFLLIARALLSCAFARLPFHSLQGPVN